MTSLELGYVVKTWQPSQKFDYVEAVQQTGQTVAIEGLVGAASDHGTFKLNLPWYDGKFDSNETSFMTGLKLSAGIVNGNVTLRCTAVLKNIKSTTSTTTP